MRTPTANRRTLQRNCLLAVGALLVAGGISVAILWWARFREPSWWIDSRSLPVTVEAGLDALSASAIRLPVDPEQPRRRGTFVVRGRDAIDVTVGTRTGFTGKDVELRLRRRVDGTVECACFATEHWDYGPPFRGALTDVTGRVRISTPVWSSGATVVVAVDLEGRLRGERRTHEAIVTFDVP